MSQHYNTTDLHLASACMARWFELTNFEKQNGKWIFYFPASHDISEFVEDYFLHKGRIDDALAMSIAIKNLKNYLFNTEK